MYIIDPRILSYRHTLRNIISNNWLLIMQLFLSGHCFKDCSTEDEKTRNSEQFSTMLLQLQNYN